MPSKDDHRPNPDDLLAGIQRAQHRARRGKLKVFFGMCPGVGKTFTMLRAAHERQAAGVRVAVGLIETHGREATERLVSGLEVIPRRKVLHRGTVLEEFDLDRTLELKPELVLVDELAHTNAPGSKHPKRYQDVRDLLFAGVDVYTTLNVQHVESRAEIVYQITGVPVRETIPDSFLEYADQIELVDISPEALLLRLKEGKVYIGERAERAAENFFREEKLTALRELSLRFTAEVVDDQLRDQMQSKQIAGPWNTNERLMVAISHSPFSARLLRSARRMAYSLEAPWVALYVDAGVELAREDHEMLVKNLNLARELGAELITTQGTDVAAALKRVAAERNVTQIVMGRPDRRFFGELLGRGNLLQQLVNETSEVDIHVIRQRRKPIYRGFSVRWPRFVSSFSDYGKAALYVGLLGLLGYPLNESLGYRAIGFGFLLGILPIAALASLGPTLLGALLSAVIWDFFFIPPRFTLAISEAEDLMMILAYIAVAAVAGLLATRIKRQASILQVREQRSRVLYEFGRGLSESTSSVEIATIGAASIEAVVPSKCVILTASAEGELSPRPVMPVEQPLTDRDFAVAAWTFNNQKKAGWRTETLGSSRCLCLPLRGRASIVGIVVIYPSQERSLSLEQENLLETIAAQLATALEREMLEAASRQSEVYAKSEKLHQTLLNSVSHELRTPLTTILGSVSVLKGLALKSPAQVPDSLVTDVSAAAERLRDTVDNLLDMSRVSGGALMLRTELFELNDFVRSAVQRQALRAEGRPLVLELAEEDLFTRGDERILEHVLRNLVSNAAQYSPPGTPITIRTRRNQSYVEFSVLDEGRGLAPGEEGRVFERFYRAPGSAQGGLGLGLSISKAIVEAHNGAVFGSNRADRSGALFSVILPAQSVPAEALE